jgi:hypothetical protein
MALKRTIMITALVEIDTPALTNKDVQDRIDYMSEPAHLSSLREQLRDHVEIHFDRPNVKSVVVTLMPIEAEQLSAK